MMGSNSGQAWQGSLLQKQLRYDEQHPRPQTPKSLSTTASALSLCGGSDVSRYDGECAIGTSRSSVTAGSAYHQPQDLAQSCLLSCVEWGSAYLLWGATVMTRTNLHAQPGWLLLFLSSVDNRCEVIPSPWRRSPCESTRPHFGRLEKCVSL